MNWAWAASLDQIWRSPNLPLYLTLATAGFVGIIVLITLLRSLGDVATANKGAGSDLLALRRAVERDRYGLMAYVLTERDRCMPSSCRAFRSLTDTRQIAANMEDRVYESLVMRYAASWNAPQA